MEDILLNSISLQLHENANLNHIPIYTDRVDQNFQVPALYVYLAYAQDRRGLRNKEIYNSRVRYSFFIVYKNGKDQMKQQDALDVFKEIRKIFRYVKVVDKANNKTYTFQVSDLDLSFNDTSMLVTLRFYVPYRIVFNDALVQSLKHNIILKEES